MGGGSKSTTTQTNSPPSWAQPLFEQSAGEASRLYNQGAGVNTYLGSTVAPLGDTTMLGVNQLANAGQGWDTAGTRNLFQGVGASAVSPSYSEQHLGQVASGQDNPFFEEALQGQLDKTAAQVQSQFSGAGRYGSGANTGVLTDRLGDIRSTAMANQWNQNIQNQLAATGQMDTSRLAGLGLGMGAAGAMSELDQRNFENRLAGAGATLQAGQIVDQNAQAQLQDEVRKFYELSGEDWQRLGLLQAAASGAAGPYGTQNATSRTSSSPGIGGILSGVGSAVGGLKSTIRLKENIRLIGKANGVNVYEFNYLKQPDKWVGVVAEELPIWHEALRMEPDGYLAVDYRKLGFQMGRVA